MPFKSKSQQRYMHWAQEHGKLPNSIDLHEWDKATDFKDLPEKKSNKFKKLKKMCTGGKV